MHDELVSIIIPAYNVANYIHRGIESVINQSYRNIELIIVDDGSTDDTGLIIEAYAQKDHRIQYIHQPNRGVSSARNLGLSLIKGEYILFLDSDDWLEKDTVEYLLSIRGAEKNVIISAGCYFAEMSEEGKIIKEKSTEESIFDCITSEEALESIGTPKYRISSACYKLFPAKIIRENNILFNESIYNAEDGLFTFQCIKKTERFIYSSEPKWNILARPGSATLSPFNVKKLTALDAMKQMLADKTNSEKLNENIYSYYLIWCLELLSECFNDKRFLNEEISYLRIEVKKIKKIYWPKNIKQKIRLLFFTYAPMRVLYKSMKIRHLIH